MCGGGVCVVSREGRRGSRHSPDVHRVQHRSQLPAQLGELVDHPRWDLSVCGACNDPSRFEQAQPVGQRMRTDAVQCLAQLAKALRAVHQLAHDQRRPRPVKQHQEPGDTTLRKLHLTHISQHTRHWCS